MLVVFCSAVNNTGDPSSSSSVSGGSLTWTRRAVATANSGGFFESLEVFTAPVTTGASMSVVWDPTATLDSASMSVVVVPDGAGVGVTAQNNAISDPLGSLTLSGNPASTSYVLSARHLSHDSGTASASPGASCEDITDATLAGTTDLGLAVQARTGSTSDTIAWTDIDANNVTTVFQRMGVAVEITIGGAVTLTPSLVTNAPAFHAPSLRKNVILTPAAHTNSQSFFGPRVRLAVKPVALADGDTVFAPAVRRTKRPALLANAASFHAPTLRLAIAPSLLVDGETIFAASLRATVKPSLLTDADAFYAPAVRHTIAPALQTSGVVLYGPSLRLTLKPVALSDGDTFYAPAVSVGAGGTTIAPPALTNAPAYFGPKLAFAVKPAVLPSGAVLRATTIRLSVKPSLLTDADAFFAPAVRRAVRPALLGGGNAFFAATLRATVKPAALSDGDTIFAASVRRTVRPALASNAQSFYAPKVAFRLRPALYADTDTFYAPAVSTGAYMIAPAAVPSGAVVYGPAIRLTLKPALRSSSAAAFAPSIGRRVAPPALANAAVVHGPRLRVTLTPPAHGNAQGYYAAHVTSPRSLQPGAFVNAQAIYAPTVGASISVDVAYETLRAWTEETWTATPLRFENETADPPVDVDGDPLAFVFFEMETNWIAEGEFGSGDPKTNVWRETGEALWHVAVPSGSGSRDARGHAEQLALMLRGLLLANGVRVGDLAIGAGDDWQAADGGNYWAMPVVAEFVREGWKLGSD